MTDIINVNINGQNFEGKAGNTILDVCSANGIKIPTLCYLEKMTPTGACRVCVVEVEGQRNLVPACAFPIAKDMVVKTHSERVIKARKTIVELILANHPKECLTCDRNGRCELQTLAHDLNISNIRFDGAMRHFPVDDSSPSIVRDPEKCILCGRCVRICDEIQTVAAVDFTERGFNSVVSSVFNRPLSRTSCVNCGQCILGCPTGALREKSHIDAVVEAIVDPTKTVIVQVAPAIRATIGEEFGMPIGSRVTGKLAAALRRTGFDKVFDTDFAADLTIMEEGSELVHRLTTGGTLPMITSCSPGWVKYIEHYYPEHLDNLSTAKSPHEMLGALLKSYYAEQEGIDPKNMVVVSIMPCTAKKFEAQRPELSNDGMQDVDYVLTTRELGTFLRTRGIDFDNLPDEQFDRIFSTGSGAGAIFGTTGGVMEAALRTAKFFLVPDNGKAADKVTSEMLERVDLTPIRGLVGVKEAEVELEGGIKVKVAVASGLSNAKKLMDDIAAGVSSYHFIEIMGCPGGCIGGGGSPLPTNADVKKKRMDALYKEDESLSLRASHDNPEVKRIYEEYLGKPLGGKSHHLLHTHYTKRGLTDL